MPGDDSRSDDVDEGILPERRLGILRISGACVAMVAWLAIAIACTAPSDSERPDVVIVLFDTLRRDHVGTYGYERDTTPTLDAIAKEGLVFENAIAQSSWTRPSVASLMTSKYHSDLHPHTYLTEASRSRPAGPMPDEALTLAEIFAANGYRTATVSTNPNVSRMFNLNQGFEEAAFKISAPADWVVDRAIDTIESVGDDDDRPLFLYLHFMDMHQPLDPPEPFASMFSTPDEKPSDDAPKVLGYLADRSSPEILGSAEFERFKSRVLARYDGSIRFADEEVGRLIDSMSEAGRWENTVFVFLSDHGEAFWDQPLLERRLDLPSFLADDVFGVGHGHTLFPDQVEVPLVMRGPGVPVARVKEQVRLIDVAPTLLSIVGVWHPDFEPRGERLVRAWQRGELTDRLALSETRTPWNRQRGIRGPEFALVRVDGDRELLFDHRAGALTEVTETRPGLLDRLREQLDARTPEPPADTEPPDGAGMWSTIDPRFCRELAELGYVLEGDCPTDRSGTDATDSAP